ncbi:MAG: hypothetical protein ACP5QT_00225 [Brevinematia bacterium]
MKKKGCLFFSFILFFSSISYSQEFSKEIGQLNLSIKKQNFYSASVKGLEIVDKLMLLLEKTMLDSIPEPGDYRLISTNAFSRVVMEKGNYDLELYSQKVFSNDFCILTITIDATEDSFEKNYSLYLSYDYLSERKDFKKLELTNKNEKIPVIIERDSLTMIYFTTENEPPKGFVVRLDYSFGARVSEKNKLQILMKDSKYISSELYRTRLKTILK